jgi:4-amino-4-deoxy-L-arabinose transferase-like glycosyltransferase
MRRAALALLLAAVVFAGVQWGTFVAGGSDSYCYAAQAERWASGRLRVVEPLALEAPWPDAALTFAPAGHVPSPTLAGAVAPICPAGLSLAMAPFRIAGGRDAIFLVVPLFGALLIGATYALGARYGARVGLAAALLTACSPIVLYQLVQPMSDVPAAALWMLAVAAATGTKPRGSVVAGVAAGAAILMRPNLVLLGVPIGLFLLLRPERTRRERLHAAGRYAAGAAVGCLAVAAIQQTLYGSPFSSGYGSLDALFALDHVAPNAIRYAQWMTDAHTVAWLLAIASPVLLPGALSSLLVAVIIVNVGLYLPYIVFEHWSFLRFLLPAVPVTLILVVATIDAAWRRLRLPHVAPALAVAALALGALFLRAAIDRNAFQLHRLEARYARAGTFAGAYLPANALVITSWQSGSVRFYGSRPTLVWDALDAAWLDRTIAFTRSRGLEPFLLFERWEEPLFRARFGGSGIAALDWPPAAEIGGQVRIYRPGDRGRYLAGQDVVTEYAR